MKIFKTNQIKSIDQYTIEHEPITSIDLMERASTALFNWFRSKYHKNRRIKIFCGPGNNGGDGLALARLLTDAGYNTLCYYLKSENYSPDFSVNLTRLTAISSSVTLIKDKKDFPELNPDDLVVDALFGSGLSRPIEGLAAELIHHINLSKSTKIAIDIPSGLFGEENPNPNPNPVIAADFCLSLQFPKLSFFMAENEPFVKNWVVLPIGLHPEAIKQTPSNFFYTTLSNLNTDFQNPMRFAHKGNFGHTLLIAGSYGMMGAACLSAKAAVRSGSGLVTMHIPKVGYPIAQISVPEALASIDSCDTHITELPNLEKYNAICVGPGIGVERSTREMITKLLSIARKPIVIDADALNILSDNINLLEKISTQVILTPHPGEFDRLFGKSQSSWERMECAIEMAKKYKVIIVLKGAYTRVVLPNSNVHFNSTGNPGMATGGSGDVLSGIITGLLARGFPPEEAAITGVYIHGLAGDLAADDFGQISLCASDILEYICKAFQHISRNED